MGLGFRGSEGVEIGVSRPFGFSRWSFQLQACNLNLKTTVLGLGEPPVHEWRAAAHESTA